jgi:alkylhydroperoxidase/carboxymuconolactone decarboxylase family protein YurZ/quercetin dioxygenase-like cupin family protein
MKKIAFIGMLLLLSCIINHTEAKDKMDALTIKEQKIVTISMYTAKGDMPKLKTALTAGLDAGLTITEIKEVLTQLYAYCGFPRSLNALSNFMTLLREREAKGIKDPVGKLPGPLPEGRSIDFGTANQTKLCGVPVKGELFDFSPAIDEYLKSHLFGDIFARDNLDWKTRELATIAALAAMDGVESQLNAHVEIGKNNGLTDMQVDAIFAIVKGDHLPDVFPKGVEISDNFIGKAWLSILVNNKECDISIYNVTFEPGCRNYWHKHAVGQILLCTVGVGYYQERGKAVRRLVPGDMVEIPANTEHWHGAAPDSEFVHIGVTPKMSENSVVWLSPVTDKEYKAATGGQ